jgi:hypothetical protein
MLTDDLQTSIWTRRQFDQTCSGQQEMDGDGSSFVQSVSLRSVRVFETLRQSSISTRENWWWCRQGLARLDRISAVVLQIMRDNDKMQKDTRRRLANVMVFSPKQKAERRLEIKVDKDGCCSTFRLTCTCSSISNSVTAMS